MNDVLAPALAALVALNWVVLLYFVLTNGWQSALLVAAALELRDQRRRTWGEERERLLGSVATPLVSMIAPAYNEAATIGASVRSLLTLRYPRLEVVVVNDGSSDATLQSLRDAFDLVPVHLVYRRTAAATSSPPEAPSASRTARGCGRGGWSSRAPPPDCCPASRWSSTSGRSCSAGSAGTASAATSSSPAPSACSTGPRCSTPAATSTTPSGRTWSSSCGCAAAAGSVDRRGVVFVPDPVAWTEAPESARVLGRQRDRWHRGLADVLVRHRRMVGNPRYGWLGLAVMPYFVLVELLGPVMEALGVLGLALALLAGAVDGTFAVLFLLVSLGWGLLLSVVAVLLDQIAYDRYRSWRDRGLLLLYACLENFGYRQLTVWWRLRGLVKFVRGSREWGAMARTGFG